MPGAADPARPFELSQLGYGTGSTAPSKCSDLGALGGTRTSNLLIRRSMQSVQPVRRNPYLQVSVLPGVRPRRHSPVPSGQSVRNL